MSTSDNETQRRALLKIEPARTLDVVDGLDLSPRSRVSPVIGVPLRSLQQRRDVNAFAASAPLPAVRAVIELIALEPLERVVAALGDHAESPTYDQLASALDALQGEGLTDDEVIAVLAYAIGESFPAAAHCRRLLEERAAYALPDVEVAAAPSLLAPARDVDPAVREARRARREAQRRTRPASPPAPRHAKGARHVPRPVEPAESAAPVTASAPTRRTARLTPREAARFDPEHVRVGTVVLVDVAYDAVDPAAEDEVAKVRPALVIAVGEDRALVRPLYSQPFTGRVLFAPWRRLLHHPSYLSDDHVEVAWPSDVVSLGELSVEEWNTLA